ncbi:DUF1580 domain-containing protein [Botrimarina mediterranea]|uniref:DUF1580 domain-containing protein n=1 Tax=Botrimarina mediterranea TaxID=2528022 RepID=A0A518K901_9BACT|nr:DUF1580 domain-containing protein [Botrimarina mediterranea]QDV74275.1 hypothetical protein Spa11_24760 [Botrimarina mediterranea]
MLKIQPGDELLPVPVAIEEAIGYRPHPTTCTRWTRKGVRGVRLESVRVGSLVKTTVAAVVRFIEAQNEAIEARNAADSHELAAAS